MIFTEKKRNPGDVHPVPRRSPKCLWSRQLKDILPAIEASAAAGIRHFEFGGGARFQAPFFYVGEDPFKCMAEIARQSARTPTCNSHPLSLRRHPDHPAHLHPSAAGQTDAQARDHNRPQLRLHERRRQSGQNRQPIVDSGMHHQVCVALMGCRSSPTKRTRRSFTSTSSANCSSATFTLTRFASRMPPHN